MGTRSHTARVVVLTTVATLLSAEPALAHVGGLGGAAVGGNVPTWLTIVTGGIIVGATFLFTSLLTDHEAIRAINAWSVTLPIPASARRIVVRVLGIASVVVLVLVVASGLFGPRPVRESFAILVVWAGWWAGYTMSVYAVGDSWPALNPWRAIARVVPRTRRLAYPDSLGSWPAVVGLLGMVWIEVISPVSSDPRFLAVLVLLYTSATLAGASLFGVGTWFSRVDPIARVFRCYGRIAPFQRTSNGIELVLPTAALARHEDDDPDATPFVIALLWATTYDGLVSTPAWEDAASLVLGSGSHPLVVYLVYLIVLATGYGLFLWLYRTAVRRARESADTFVSADYLERYFAPSLLPIAAGYHVAHFLGYFLSLLPQTVSAMLHPGLTVFDLETGATLLGRAVLIPDWFGLLQLGFVLGGHILAVWVAHARSFELFPGAFKPIRSQYPITVAMIAYTLASMWIVVQPLTAPPFV